MHQLNIIRSMFLYLQSCFSWLYSSMKSNVHLHKAELITTKLYEPVEKYSFSHRENASIIADLDGTLTRSSCPFPYYMLVAYEAGSPLRGLILLILWPFIWLVQTFISESAATHMLIFVSTFGIKESDLEGVGRAVLSSFYVQDMHPQSFKVFLSCGRRCVVTSSPRVMVEPFLREYLGVELVIGTELRTVKGYVTGFLNGYGVLHGLKKRDAIKAAFASNQPDIGLCDMSGDLGFLSVCKEAYVVTSKNMEAVPREEYPKPLIFHDGRLAMRPTPIASLFIYLWIPIGFALAITRFLVWIVLPAELSVPISSLLGIKLRIAGSPPVPPALTTSAMISTSLTTSPSSDLSSTSSDKKGMLYVCTHRTLLDPIVLSVALRRRMTAVTYSLSRVSEVLSPIKTVRLTRSREQDAKTIEKMLSEGDLVICPEGTTCREPYLLRYSPLFAEITNELVPVGTRVEMTMFHGTTAKGFKGMDPFYFLMNPRPTYSITILDPLPEEETCAGGKTSVEVANHIQRLLGKVMGYQCTNLTRKDKYRVLAGNDGIVQQPSIFPNRETCLHWFTSTLRNISSPSSLNSSSKASRKLF